MIYVMVLTIALFPVVLGYIVLDDYLKDRQDSKMTFSKVYDQIQYNHKHDQAVKAANLASANIKDPYYYKKEWYNAYNVEMAK